MATTADNGVQSLNSGSAIEDRQSLVSSVQSQIDVLTDLSKRLQTLRQFPGGLLRSEHASGANQVLQVPPSSTLKGTFSKSIEDLRTLHVAAMEERVQEALRAAVESERRDGTEIEDPQGQESQERRRSPSPESPKPFLVFQHKVASPFPPLVGTLPLTLQDLPTYIREFNATHAKKMLLHIYLASGHESRKVSVPVVLRFLIPDVLRMFITLGHEEGVDGTASETSALMVESLTVFGSREKASASRNRAPLHSPYFQKPPHSQSEFIVFQKLSQWIVRALQSSPRVHVQGFMDMLVAYESLFLEKCSLCQRFLSAEGYLPPVARVRREDGAWEPQHATCVQN
ncbi:hypothetical protein B0F90DRAFT_1625077 [Multifurca ochricompacta]|uniref:Mediator of RNA polymerase II transcription subunit 27 n=1 Tax=Multifurca ochricompacta TaxID=376703 RepID=A0AAD4M7T8_9AGAM|nr:hypothetical protein B0F90DRAFT_1625077 [Multifurca ochricompacta]